MCELENPWKWLGHGALVMTTGIPIPAAADEQVAFIERLHQAGMAGIAIGEHMSAPPLTAAVLQRAHELGFPLLSTAADQPFLSLAQAVSAANSRQRQERLRIAEKIYEALATVLPVGTVDPFLETLGELLGGTLKLVVVSGTLPPSARDDDWRALIPLATHPTLSIEFTSRTGRNPDRALLQYASAAVSSLLALHAASRRRESAQGALLLGRLIDGTVDPQTAEDLVAPHGLNPDYRVITWRSNASAEQIEALTDALVAAGIQHLANVRDGLMILLIGSESEAVPQLADLIDASKIGASAGFRTIGEVRTAFRQSRSALDFPSSFTLNLYESLHGFSPFLSNDLELLEATALEILRPLLDNDESRNTSLLQTLQVFLEENRNWSKTSGRLHIHRQTLYARVSRIEALTGKDLSSVAAISDFWLALQAASSLGLIPQTPVAADE